MIDTITLRECLPSNHDSHRALNNILSIPMRQIPPLPESIKLFHEMRVQFMKWRLGIKHQKESLRQVSVKAAWCFGVKRCPGGGIVPSVKFR